MSKYIVIIFWSKISIVLQYIYFLKNIWNQIKLNRNRTEKFGSYLEDLESKTKLFGSCLKDLEFETKPN